MSCRQAAQRVKIPGLVAEFIGSGFIFDQPHAAAVYDRSINGDFRGY
jgi:hypothetical protein